MKDELLKIIDFELGESNLKGLVLKHCSDLIDYYENRRSQTIEKLTSLLNKYNFQTIDKINECPDYPSVTLFKGVDTFTFYPVIDYQGGISEIDSEIGVIIEQCELWLKNDILSEQEQDSLSGYSWQYHKIIIFTWLASIWQEIDGDKYGIVVKTLENNSCSAFIFNDFSWDELSNYRHYGDRTKPIEKYFSRNLTIFEIFQRLRTITYPVNPYQNKWRVLTNGNEVFEIVNYANETGERTYFLNSNTQKLNTIVHNNLLEAIRYVKNQTEIYIAKGFQEQQILKTESIYEEAIEVGFHSGVHWYSNEQQNRLQIQIVNNFEDKFKIKLPFYFKHYLRLFNGRKYNNYMTNFYIGNNRYMRVTEFYNIDELTEQLENKAKNSKSSWIGNIFNKNEHVVEWLKIATINSTEILMLNLNSNSCEFGNLAVFHTEKESYTPLEISFKDFVSKNQY